MIKSFTVTNHIGDSLTMSLSNPQESGLLVWNAEGLGPVKANVSVTDLATMDGGLFNASRLPTRNIVLTLVLLEHPTIEDTRHLVYRYFPIKQRIKLEIETDYRTCYAYGYVESNEPSIWSTTQSCQISIICPDPYFYKSGAEETIVFSALDKMFEFPFENPSLTQKLITFANITRDYSKTFTYTGDSPTGMELTIHCMGPIHNIRVAKVDTRETLSIDTNKIAGITGSSLGVSDEIIISTMSGNKTVKLLKNGLYYNIINALGRDSDWPTINIGDNTFAYGADSGADNIYLVAKYRDTYQGV